MDIDTLKLIIIASNIAEYDYRLYGDIMYFPNTLHYINCKNDGKKMLVRLNDYSSVDIDIPDNMLDKPIKISSNEIYYNEHFNNIIDEMQVYINRYSSLIYNHYEYNHDIDEYILERYEDYIETLDSLLESEVPNILFYFVLADYLIKKINYKYFNFFINSHPSDIYGNKSLYYKKENSFIKINFDFYNYISNCNIFGFELISIFDFIEEESTLTIPKYNLFDNTYININYINSL